MGSYRAIQIELLTFKNENERNEVLFYPA